MPVVIANQPLDALSKQAQWLHPNLFSKMCLSGPLHIEMAFMNAIGN